MPSDVALTEPLGNETIVELLASGQVFEARVAPPVRPRAGQALTVWFDMSRAHLFEPATERAL